MQNRSIVLITLVLLFPLSRPHPLFASSIDEPAADTAEQGTTAPPSQLYERIFRRGPPQSSRVGTRTYQVSNE
jgi:hypothetical protein